MLKRIFYEVGYVFPGTHLQVLENMPTKGGKGQVRCKCLYKGCGNEAVIFAKNAKNLFTKSCGCLGAELRLEKKNKNTTHGISGHRLYRIWQGMNRRCYDAKDKHYSYYGERGIFICEEWKSDIMVFYNWAIQNGYQVGLEVDRIDNNGPYSPLNCRFVTHAENLRNKRNNRILTIDGVTCVLADHAERSGISSRTIRDRIKRKWEQDRLLSAPRSRAQSNRQVSV